jgi:hypothetical protein
MVLPTESAGENLAAEADAEHSTVPRLEVTEKVEKLREVRIFAVGQRVLTAAKHHCRVVAIDALRQRIAAMGAAKIDFGAGFGEGLTDLAEACIVVVLDDQNPQRRPLLTAFAMPVAYHAPDASEKEEAVPLQNRVDPFGEVHAVPSRGMFTGNRGVIHNPETKTLTARRWTTKAWLICECEFKGVRREPMGRNTHTGNAGWTELFFLDEVTALAAGHRPCFYCRREKAKEFAGCYAVALSIAEPRVMGIDARLHEERRASAPKAAVAGTILDKDAIAALSDGVMVAANGNAFAIKGGGLLPWSFGGYGAAVPRETLDGAEVRLLTPPTTVAVLKTGYRPVWHPTHGG